jgi:hypothetical protein
MTTQTPDKKISYKWDIKGLKKSADLIRKYEEAETKDQEESNGGNSTEVRLQAHSR